MEDGQLRYRQEKFLRALRDEVILLPELLARAEVQPHLLARWLRRKFFREAANDTLTQMRRAMRLDLELLVKAARHALGEMLRDSSKRDEVLILLCRTILEEHHRLQQRRRRPQRKKRASEPVDLVHPNAKAREEEMLGILAGRE